MFQHVILSEFRIYFWFKYNLHIASIHIFFFLSFEDLSIDTILNLFTSIVVFQLFSSKLL